jgi:hypothetical protein
MSDEERERKALSLASAQAGEAASQIGPATLVAMTTLMILLAGSIMQPSRLRGHSWP